MYELEVGNFQVVDEAVFQRLTELPVHTADCSPSSANFCPDCKVPMEISGVEYQCKMCGLTIRGDGEAPKDHDETVSGSLRITTGANKGRFYNNTGDYAKTQHKMIMDQLTQRYAQYKGPVIPHNVLRAAATQYNHIQKMITEDDIDENGNVRGQKKFVRRGNIKDEVLAGLIYFECVREKIVRKKRDIAAFMSLPANGFARGENLLRDLEAEGKIDIPTEDEPIEGFIDRYLEALNIENASYGKFIEEIVLESEARRIGMNSQISSKVVGALWIVITKCRLNITALALERATDNTKKNTFMKFHNMVLDNMAIFGPIFTKYNIPK